MEIFLKETIPGIIILGAIGSIVATLLIWGINKAIKIIAPKLYEFVRNLLSTIVVAIIAPGIKNQIRLYLDGNTNKLDAYYSSQKTKVIIFSALFVCLFIWFSTRLQFNTLELNSFESISYISSLFLTFGVMLRSHLCIMVPLFIDIDSRVEKEIKARKLEISIKARTKKNQ